MKQLLLLIATFALTNISLAQTYSGGAGTKPNPYLISNKADLKFLSETSTDWNKHFKQTANINFTSSDFAIGGAFYNAGEGFSPIGLTGSFTGSYNGQHYSIDSLKIVRPSVNYVGLFSIVSTLDTLKNIAITNCNIQGFEMVGGLVGNTNGVILNSYATGIVTGTNYLGGLIGGSSAKISNSYATCSVSGTTNFVGGLVGSILNGAAISNSYAKGAVSGSNTVGGLVGSIANGATISNSYATGVVTGTNYIGGLVGVNSATISNSYATGVVTSVNYGGGLVGWNLTTGSILNSYATGVVTGTIAIGGLVGWCDGGIISKSYATGSVTGNTLPGGLVAYFSSGTISNSFWDTQTTGQSTSNGGGIGKTTAEMKTLSTFTSATWDFVGEATNGAADIWQMGVCNLDGSSYPILSWQVGLSGSGTAINPYLIQSKNNLKTLSENPCLWNQHFKQTANINFTSADFAMGGAFYNAGDGFSPIGDGSTNFTGSYNGQGFVIDSLKINRPSQSPVGLFGYVNTSDSLQFIRITNCSIIGSSYVGALVGENWGTILNSSSSGLVSGNSRVGGLIGRNFSIISNAYSNGAVSGNDRVGGLVGDNRQTITNAYATGSVSGNDRVGGLVGFYDSGTISNTYATSAVSGTTNIGGLIGFNNGVSTITNSFWDTQTTGQNASGGGTGKSSLEMKTLATFTSATWDFVGETANGTADIWQMNCATNNGYPVFSWQALNTPPAINIATTKNGLIITANANGLAYQWINCATNMAIAGEMNQTFTATTNGNYKVAITDGVCSDTSACVSITTVGIKENLNALAVVRAYPNPITSLLTIELAGANETYYVELTNTLGQVVLSETSKGKNLTLATENLNAGVYFVKVKNHQPIKIIKN
jgi:hypothetical protein